MLLDGREVDDGCAAGWESIGLLCGRRVGLLLPCWVGEDYAARSERDGRRLRCWLERWDDGYTAELERIGLTAGRKKSEDGGRVGV
jgi:hypothetical protein